MPSLHGDLTFSRGFGSGHFIVGGLHFLHLLAQRLVLRGGGGRCGWRGVGGRFIRRQSDQRAADEQCGDE
jgi:hypothetical protein